MVYSAASDSVKTMVTLLLQVFVLLACLLHTSEGGLCVHSIDITSGNVTYLEVHNGTNSNSIAHFEDEIFEETVMVIVKVTVPSDEKGDDSRVYIYQLADTSWCYSVSPELIDLMTLNSLSLVKRTQIISLDVRTPFICGNKSWENLLKDSFGLDHQSVRCAYYKVISSRQLVFVLLGLGCVCAVLACFHS